MKRFLFIFALMVAAITAHAQSFLGIPYGTPFDKV